MKRILIIVSTGVLSGGEFVLGDLLKKDNENEYYLLIPEIPVVYDYFMQFVSSERIIMHNAYAFQGSGQSKGLSRLFRLFKKSWAIRAGRRVAAQAIRKWGIEILIGHNTTDVLFFPHKKQKNILIVQDDVLGKKAYRWAIEVFKSMVDIYIAGSRTVEKGLTQCGIEGNKNRLIYNGIGINDSLPRSKKVSDGGKLMLCWIGSIEERKNPMEFLSIVEVLVEKGFDVEANLIFRIVDVHYYILFLEKLAAMKESRIVRLFADVPRHKLPEYYRSSDIMVCTSLNDAMPTVLAEAGSYAVPAIGRNIDGTNEIIRNGENGFLFDSIDDIPKAIGKIVAYYPVFSENALKVVHEHFSLDRRVEAMQKLYSEE